ncbi:hypothetical protein CTEN210_09893 [Chaetoceros tenuissimus]|uniref:EF-hand domain-containing protein n=1 Tax=Chaetoceros tenuissimus TaxID=426638 RepID=A0AAD3H7G4_9STRA|nr:hypothetical protein CTEN210_09893 [Chaetoceros tenuissimus]
MATEASNLLNKENIDAVKEKAEKVAHQAMLYAQSVANGNASIRTAALVAGIFLCLNTLSTFMSDLFSFHINAAIIDIYGFFVGASAIVMESDREAVPYADKLRGILGKNVGLVRTVTGRGLFYCVAASLQLSSTTVRSNIIGYIVFAIGVLYIVLGNMAHKKFKNIRNKKFSERQVKNMFAKYDKDDSNRLEFEEFQLLMKDLDVKLTVQESELMYLSIDTDMKHGITLDEFQEFWLNSPALDTFTV